MIEVNIRVFFQKSGTGLFPDYHRHIKMIEEQLPGKVRVYLDETEAMPICQYYSLSPFGCMEIRYLRRMKLGKSVMCLTEGSTAYAQDMHLPRFVKRAVSLYLKKYLNSFDYIVVASGRGTECL